MTIDFPNVQLISGLRNLWQEAFGDTDTFLDCFFSTGFSQDRCRCICEHGKPVAALYWFDCNWGEKRLAYLYAVATAKSHRGHGLCHRLMEDTHALLRQQGYDGIVLVPAQPSLFSFYEKMGYRCFGGIRQWNATAGEPISLKELDAIQYATLRTGYLPENSVRQDGKLLDFLGSYARFYQGADFLVCCAEDDGRLMAYELLGNTAAADGILAALKLKTGTFRAPGNAPFSMYYPLANDHTFPGYFAFALD